MDLKQLANLLSPEVASAMQADPNSAKYLAPVKGIQPDAMSLNMGTDNGGQGLPIDPWLLAGMNDPAAYQKRLYQEGEFSDADRWAPGAEQGIMRNATYDPKYGLMYNINDAEKYWIPREYSAFSNLMEKAIPLVAGGLMVGGATGLIGAGGEAAAAPELLNAGAGELAAINGSGAADFAGSLANLGANGVGSDLTGGLMLTDMAGGVPASTLASAVEGGSLLPAAATDLGLGAGGAPWAQWGAPQGSSLLDTLKTINKGRSALNSVTGQKQKQPTVATAGMATLASLLENGGNPNYSGYNLPGSQTSTQINNGSRLGADAPDWLRQEEARMMSNNPYAMTGHALPYKLG